MGHFNGKIGNAHAPCHVTGLKGLIQNHIFGISDPYLPIHYTTSMGLQRQLREFRYMGALVVKLWGTPGNDIPLPFLAGERRSLAYTMTATYNTSNRIKCALNASFKVTPIVNRGNF